MPNRSIFSPSWALRSWAGAGNAIAGGGTVLSFPILIWVGLPPVPANATNAIGLWSGSVGGAWSYRGRIRRQAGWAGLWIPALLGGAAGAGLLLYLPPHWFGAAAPWLVIGAAGLIAAEPLLRRHLPMPVPGERRMLPSAVVLFLISVYGGYFGAGIGMLILFSLSLLGIDDLHDANGLKNLLVAGIKGVAVVGFVLAGVVAWAVALVMLVGSTAGGWAGGYLVQKVDQGALRWIVVTVGVGLGMVMLVR